MAQMVMNIPDADATRVVDALCDLGEWTEADGPRPAFAKKMVARYMRRVTRAYEAKLAREAAAAAVQIPPEVDVT